MPTIEDVLEKKTYKQAGLDVGRRVFYTLTGNESELNREKSQANRNSKAIALIFETLRKNNHITDPDIDAILLELVH